MHSSLFNYRNVPVIIGVIGGATFHKHKHSIDTVKFWCTVESE